MEVISLGHNYSKPIVMCLGFFDCMHLGHLELLAAARKIAGSSAQIALFTFENNHFETLNRPTKLIYTYSERLSLYKSLGLDVVVSAHFDDNFRKLSGRQFLEQISRFNLAGVVCGQDYTCGADLISATGVQEFFADVAPVTIVPLIERGNEKVSSTLVRNLLLNSDVRCANALLSEPFFFQGTVMHGRNVGHTLGFPTLNLPIPSEKIVPCGVYVGTCEFAGGARRAIVNVGAQPTFLQGGCVVEAHLVDFNGDLYGHTVKISLTKFLRPIMKFRSAEELRAQLQQDLEAVYD